MEKHKSSEPNQVASKKTNFRKSVARGNSFWMKLALIAMGCLISLVMTEAILVGFRISFPLLYQADDVCGTKLKPGLNVRYIEEGQSIVKTNSIGFRDFEHTLNKPAGVFRIAVIGDSFCEGLQVDVTKTFWHLLGTRLQDQDNRLVEVLNFGTSGYGTAQELETLKKYAAGFKPDLTILAIFTGNDIGDNSSKINQGQIKPYYQYQDGELVLDRRFRQDPKFVSNRSAFTRFKAGLINSSRSLQLANKFYSAWKNRRVSGDRSDIGLDPNVYRSPGPGTEWEEAWRVTEGLLMLFQEECRRMNSGLLIVTLSNPIQVHPDRKRKSEFLEQNTIDDLFYPDRRLLNFCESNEIVCLSLAETFSMAVDSASHSLYLHGFSNTKMGAGHWNEDGHQLASETIYSFLTVGGGNGLLPGGKRD